MKKRGRRLLWVAFAVLVLFLVTTVAMKPEIDGSANDIFLYKMGGASLFAIWLSGVVLELDIFHIRKNIPLIKISSPMAMRIMPPRIWDLLARRVPKVFPIFTPVMQMKKVTMAMMMEQTRAMIRS